jgi:hypothetical protein
MTTDNFCFYLQNRLIPTGQTGGQPYSDTSPFSIPCGNIQKQKYYLNMVINGKVMGAWELKVATILTTQV